MTSSTPRILVTGASGQLGRLVIRHLLAATEPARIVASVRSRSAAAELAALGIELREADYDNPASLGAAYAGVDRLLLISSSAVGQRVPQHRNAIAAAREAGVGMIAYTGLLHGEVSPLALRREHVETEAMLLDSGIPSAVLRNGWYTENYLGAAASALQLGVLSGGSGAGRISAAAREDYAEAAAKVLLTGVEQGSRIYELAGDEAFTLAEFAAELARLSGRPIEYRDLPEADYAALLVKAGLPAPFAAMLADSDVGASKGGLYDSSRMLSRLIGRPTTPLATVLSRTLKG